MTDSKQLVQKLWNYCDILRDDGLSYGDYVEQLTFLLFLKMDDERIKPPFNKKSDIPKEYNWQSLLAKDGAELEAHYIKTLQELGKQEGIIGVIFRKAQNRIQDPAKIRKLIVELIDKENWLSLEADVKGDAYEGLLEKNAVDVKGGAGQYFTPRALIDAMVEVMKPEPGMKIHDPACGTGGFLLSAYNYIVKHHQMDRDQKHELKHKTFTGNEIVPMAARLCVMNLYLHGINGEENPIMVEDSLKNNPGAIYDMVLTNPPFGKKSSETIITETGKEAKKDLTIVRDDFWAKTSNKQLNFLQHVRSILKINGKAAIVLPDNVLFEGGAGGTVRKKLMQTCDLHTIIRLPTGVFYAQGVKANVLFFDKKEASEKSWTSKVWIYDLRTNKNFTLKENPLKFEDLKDFIKCYNPENRFDRKETEQFKCFGYEEILKRDKTNLDVLWIKDKCLDDLENLQYPDVIANELIEELEGALEHLREINFNS
ncbi:MAG: N-6 DNA methylase [Candidatus Altiarchaeum hamiconexum]|uniref:site-specific DNA-methyltransferase (adenine-specific) n=1 Tax=Candidatus Altarchaeum hamiconexum TaxID=1803513 RepID=A0A8J8CHL7_9ARCH|nr:N-6 DNA methylase [Candidatus Altarchaeum hamiconexum]OIQ06132.1 MAG: DNA methyltransferase [Candidatus Altarchaeum sp. CG2_30_32_3053]PIN67341.1 MAG: DNA methyltransferase [Candidatus Altarchaeum sp. CG12_big_fil_rev_8_21_14_0_65_33_22]PIV28474.1 MAG: DNA methyltransferase [Candidatus Altarchaeum sp. CG03_land_8_20_14_0_80_32_618]PIX49305.1 MAG: DNA methyltransferase [Candidatus Altarchaeum sp. CG_4_8_14_3_um_filter_33_2054]PIZ32112.1 MAG: DNA methyltransferase [Candidatus Altarchaeum sp. 